MSVPTAPPALLYSSHFSLGFGAFCLFSRIFGVVFRGFSCAWDPLRPALAAPHSLSQPLVPQTEPGQAEVVPQISPNTEQDKPKHLGPWLWKRVQVVLLEAEAMPRAKPEFSEIPDTKNRQEP